MRYSSGWFALCIVTASISASGANEKKPPLPEDPPLAIHDAASRYWRFVDNPAAHERGGAPKLEDEKHAKIMAEDVQCQICKQILMNLLNVSTSRVLDRDSALDLLEGDVNDNRPPVAMTRDQKNVEKSRKGCKRHFKNSYLATGWDIAECVKFPKGVDPKTDRDLGAIGHCVKHTGVHMTEEWMATYSLEKEAIYVACKQTIEAYMEDIADFLDSHSHGIAAQQGKKDALEELSLEACKTKAMCLHRKHSLTVEERSASLKKHKQRQGVHEARTTEQGSPAKASSEDSQLPGIRALQEQMERHGKDTTAVEGPTQKRRRRRKRKQKPDRRNEDL